MSFNALLKNAAGYALAFQATDITTPEMRIAIPEWFSMYYQKIPDKREDPCQQIPYTIVRKLAKTVFSEYEATSQNEYASGILEALENKAMEAMQLALIGGESKLKPIPTDTGFRFVVVPRYNILVFGRDADGNMTDVGMVEQTVAGKFYYTLLERRSVDANGFLTIRYRLFRAYNRENLGSEVPLASIPKFEDLEPEYTFAMPVGSVGLPFLFSGNWRRTAVYHRLHPGQAAPRQEAGEVGERLLHGK